MSEVSQILDNLEVNLFKTLQKLEALQRANSELKSQLDQAQQTVEQQKTTLQEWEEKFESFRMASSIVGSSDNTTEAKLKINTLIREIDHCIAQLSE